MKIIERNTAEWNAELAQLNTGEEENLRDRVTIYKVQDRAMSLDAYYRVSSYRTAQKYRIIGHFFPKYRTK